jgi:mRNA-degrading endonuclease YafQ of YafQ-DinJ toxin-antitoxin module
MGMLLHEILAPVRSISATNRFRETFKMFRQAYPSIDKTLREFLDFRTTHRPDEMYGAKDTPFVSRELRGFRHFHLVHGRVILIYQITHSELRLCLVMDHSYSTKQGQSSLGAYLNSPQTSFQPIGQAKPHLLTKTQIQAINDLFFEYAAQDRHGFQQALRGDLEHLMEFIRLVLEVPWSKAEKDQATLSAFGGIEGLRQAANRVLQQTKQTATVE